MKALVTGGCGFIGSNLVRALLEDNWEVEIVDDLSSGDMGLLNGINLGLSQHKWLIFILKRKTRARPNY